MNSVQKFIFYLVLGAAALVAFVKLTEKAPIVLSANPGGNIMEFIEEFADIRHANKEVHVEDICLSACTLVLGLIPRDRICADPQAVFGFHSAWVMGPFGPEFAREGTRIVWHLYPEDVQLELKKQGWDGDGDKPHPNLLYIPAQQFVKACHG